MVVTGHERYKGGSRVRFVCGDRALRTFHEQSAILDRLAATLSSARTALPEAVERLLDQATEGRKERERLLERTLALEAASLHEAASAKSPDLPVVVTRLDERGPDELLGLAQAVVAQGPCVVFLGAVPPGQGLSRVRAVSRRRLRHPEPPQGLPRPPSVDAAAERATWRGAEARLVAGIDGRPGRRRRRRVSASPRAHDRADSPYFVLLLGVLFVSVGSIFVRLTQAPALAVAFYRIAFATVLLAPFALASARAQRPLPGPEVAPASPGLRGGAGPPLRHLDQQPVLHLHRLVGAAREHGPHLRPRPLADVPRREGGHDRARRHRPRLRGGRAHRRGRLGNGAEHALRQPAGGGRSRRPWPAITSWAEDFATPSPSTPTCSRCGRWPRSPWPPSPRPSAPRSRPIRRRPGSASWPWPSCPRCSATAW